ncbi:MAG TPA: LacI family DNA-binding transcriptional regulator [Anaerolineae bacterium]|nr:LacI family DNA-binding transcriptional regulator [Anaerolineae bacterium]
MSTSLADVAKAAGVSNATASRVLANSDYPVTEETRQKVLKAAEALDYRPNLIARGLRTEQTACVGLIVENILSPFIPPITRGIHDYLRQHDYSGIIINADWDPVAETKAMADLARRHIDGVILVESYTRSSDEVARLIDKPHIFVHRLFNSLNPYSVVPDDRHGARLAVKHLAGLGHQRIAFINGPAGWDATINRLAGYQDELAAWNLPFDPTLVIRGDWEVQSGYSAAQQLLALQSPPTAIFAANDLMALGVVYAAQGAGLRVPEDVALVGYDNRDFSGFVRPALTTVRMPCEEMGWIAAESLLRLINQEVAMIEPVLVKGELVTRQSCGAIQGEWQFEPEQGSIIRRQYQEEGNLTAPAA